MKLSEAMRLGLKTGKQLFNQGTDSDGGTCAGMAMVRGFAENGQLLPATPSLSAECPYSRCGVRYTSGSFFGKPAEVPGRPRTLLDVIIHLNNDHRWTRENIAYWLELTVDDPAPDRKIPLAEVMEFVGEPLVRECVSIAKPSGVTKKTLALALPKG